MVWEVDEEPVKEFTYDMGELDSFGLKVVKSKEGNN
jgi:hypothetical protein